MLQADAIRSHFPALSSGATFFDTPGGSQVARESLDRIAHYLQHTNANHGGAFRTSEESDAVIAESRQAFADFLHAARAEEIVFGGNMTTLTLHISRSIARTLTPGDEIIVTRLDHDANISPWLLVAEDRGCTVRWVDFHPEDCTLALDDLESQITPRTRLVAVGYASNAVGTINDVRRAVQIAHQAGALCYIDAVQYAPHGPIDVQALDCDFLVCSAYKYFGPHVGVLYGKYDLLDSLTAYKVRPSGQNPPDKFETGTPNFEGIAGAFGALEYLQWVGETYGADFAETYANLSGRSKTLKQAMAVIRAYETGLSRALLEGLGSVPGIHVRGITDLTCLDNRVPTVSFTLPGRHPRLIAEELDAEDIYVWDGNFYAPSVTERLGVEEAGGMVRVGAAHYNTPQEIAHLAEVLKRFDY